MDSTILTRVFKLAAFAVFVFLLGYPGEAFAQNHEPRDETEVSLRADFELSFGRDEFRFDQRVRRLRSVGWTVFGAGWTLFAMSFFVGNKGGIDIDLDEGARLRLLIGGPTAAAALWVISGGILIRARRLVTRRARWRTSHGISRTEPTWDFRLGAGSAEWTLRF